MVLLNTYVGKYPASASIKVDAKDMASAVTTMIEQNGDEPIQVIKTDTAVIAVPDEPTVEFTAEVANIDNLVPGHIYPSSSEVPVNTTIIFNAVPEFGFVFDHYEDAKGKLLADTPEYRTIVNSKNNYIKAVFALDSSSN